MEGKMEGKVVILTGASSGIGKETARLLVREGYVVYGAARHMDEAAAEVPGLIPVTADISKDEDCEALFYRVLGERNQVDILINNAGFGVYGAVEDVDLSLARTEFGVNFFGMAKLCQLAVPKMREQGAGTIVNMASIAGKMQAPLGSWYHASKHAIEGFSDCLRLEVEPFGIHVVIVEPGLIRTPFYAVARDILLAASEDGAYADKAKALAQTFQEIESGQGDMGGSDPADVAEVISEALREETPKTRYVVGKMARMSLFSRQVMPDRLYDRIIKREMTGD